MNLRTKTTLLSAALLIALLGIVAPAAGTTKPGPNLPGGAIADPWNSLISFQVGSDGLFNMGAYPDPATGNSTTGSWDLMFSWPSAPWSSFTTVRIDGLDYRFGEGGAWSQSPTNTDALTNTAVWVTGETEVTQTLTLWNSPSTGRQDLVRIEYQVKNLGAAAHTVGLRFMNDVEINYNDGSPFRVPSVGAVTTEQDFTGAGIPQDFLVFMDLTDSTHVAYGAVGEGLAPDRLIIGRWPGLYGTQWDYTVTPGLGITSDSAYAFYWNPASLASGETRSYVSYYGLGSFDADLVPPLGLGLSGPSALAISGSDYSPNPFDVVATVQNLGDADLAGVSVTLNLPAGLELVGGSQTQAVGALTVGQQAQVTWTVRALPQATATTVVYSVTGSATDVTPKTVGRNLLLPALSGTQKSTSTTYTGAATVQYSDPVSLSGTLLDTSVLPTIGIAGKQLDFTLGTQTASASPTDASGNASTSLIVTQKPGSVTTVDTAFAGDAEYLASSDSDAFTIAKEDCTIAYSGDTLVPPATATTLAADLGELDAWVGDLSGKTVVFTVTGVSTPQQTFTAVTDASGHATTSANLGPDVYSVSVSFAGDDYYKPCSTATDTLVTVQSATAKVTGGGWISSGGRTSFGFNAIPIAGGWKGQFQLRPHSGKDRFHGGVVTTLTSSGNTATWSGTGYWNKVPGYTYTISVVDNGSSGSKKLDTISITIKSPTNTVAYTSGGPQTLKGGNITVHK